MIRQLTFITLILYPSLISFNHSRLLSNDEYNIIKIDSAKAIYLGNFVLQPKDPFEFSLINNGLSDTLALRTCTEYVYYPFGRLNNKSDLLHSKLSNFNIRNRIDKKDIGDVEFQILTLKSSRLILFFDNDPEASKHSYILKGEIKDSEVNFLEGIKIGMAKDIFFTIFFEKFPVALLKQYNYFVLKSCIDDITHTYSFKDNKLQSIDFITDSYWVVNY